jgi:diaminopimelate decarboxylase
VNHLPPILSSRWQSDAGELRVGSLPVSAIADRYRTPLFVHDYRILEEKLTALTEALPASFQVFYSMKANPTPFFLQFFLQKGCGIEVASAGELEQALNAGCPAERILFAGPGKTESELVLAISLGVGEIHAESQLEIERIIRIARVRNRPVPIAVRVNPCAEGLGGAMRMGGKSAPFGIDEENLLPILHLVRQSPQLRFRGIHLFAGTQILDHQVLLAQYRRGIQIARNAYVATGLPLHTVDFGGGLGIPYFPGDAELNLNGLRDGLRELIQSINGAACFAGTRFVVEPGRFLVGGSGIYVTRVNDIKVSRGKKYVIVDGGMNHHLAASGNLGQVIKRNFPIAVLNKLDHPFTETVDVVGPLCTPLDTLARAIDFPDVEVGDLVGIFQSGAYARSASPLGFLGHPSPPVVVVREQRDQLICQRGSWGDATSQDLNERSLVMQAAS